MKKFLVALLCCATIVRAQGPPPPSKLSQLRGDVDVITAPPVANVSFLKWNGSKWVPGSVPAQVQPNWTAVSGLGQILNKPTIPQLTSISFTTPNVIFQSPVSFTNTSGAWGGSLQLNTQAANTVLAGPTTGSAAAPTFRALSSADLSDMGNIAFKNIANIFSAGQTISGGNTLTFSSASGSVIFGASASQGAGSYSMRLPTITGNDVVAGLATPQTFTAVETFQGQINGIPGTGLVFNPGGGTITANSPFTINSTWNSSGVTFTGLKENITDTASAAGSLLIDLQVGGVSKFSIDKTGALTAGSFPAGNLTGSHTLPDGVLSTNVPLLNAANTFTGANAQTFGGNVVLNSGATNPIINYPATGTGSSIVFSANEIFMRLAGGTGLATLDCGALFSGGITTSGNINVTTSLVAASMLFDSRTGISTDGGDHSLVFKVGTISVGSATNQSGQQGIETRGGGGFFFSSSTNPDGVADAAFFRSAPGISEIDSGTLGKFGQFQAGTIALQSVTTPSAATLSITGGAAGSYSYKLTAEQADGTSTDPSAVVSTAVGPTTLDGTHTITVTAPGTLPTGASRFGVWRTVGGVAQGKIGTITAASGTLVDNGQGVTGTIPTYNSTGSISTGGSGLFIPTGGSSATGLRIGAGGAGFYTAGDSDMRFFLSNGNPELVLQHGTVQLGGNTWQIVWPGSPSHSFVGNYGGAGMAINIDGARLAYFRNSGFGTGITLKSDLGFGWSSNSPGDQSADLWLGRDGANTLAQRNGTNAQTYNLYGSYDGTNNRGIAFQGSGTGSVPTIKSIATGTFASAGYGLAFNTADTSGNVNFQINSVNKWVVSNSSNTSTNNFFFGTDNTYDFGASGASRVRKAYIGRAVNLPAFTVSTLPTSGSTPPAQAGDEAYVTDATAPTYLGTLTGGGSVSVNVLYNGTAWVAD